MSFDWNFRYPANGSMNKKRRKQIMQFVESPLAGEHSMVLSLPAASAVLARAEMFESQKTLVASHIDQFDQTTICFEWPKKGLIAVFEDSKFNETVKVFIRAKKLKNLAKFVAALDSPAPACTQCNEIIARQNFCGQCGSVVEQENSPGRLNGDNN